VASRGRKRSENAETPSDLNRKSLRGASLFALRRLELLEGSREAAIARLLGEFRRQPNHPLAGESPESLDRWFGRRGIPEKILGDPVALAFLFTDVSALVVRHDVDERTRQRRRQVLAHTGLLDVSELEPDTDRAVLEVPSRLEEVRALQRLKKMGEKLIAREAEYRQRSRSLAAAVADELGVPLRTVRRWLDEGRISGAGYRRFRQHERQKRASEAQDKRDRKVFQQLMTAGRKPFVVRKVGERYWDRKKAKWVTPRKMVEAPTVPVFRSSEGYYGGDMTSGYRWNTAVRDYLTPASLGKMLRIVRELPKTAFRKRMRRRLPEWAVFIVVSALYSQDGDRGHPVEARSGSGYRYGAHVREDLAAVFEEARRFVVKESYTSGNWPSLEAALAEFERRMWLEIQSDDLTWVHGIVVWNFRRRTAEEWASIVEARRLESVERYRAKKRSKKTKTRKTLSARGKAARAEYEQRKKRGKKP
jgi:hypothetical protein